MHRQNAPLEWWCSVGCLVISCGLISCGLCLVSVADEPLVPNKAAGALRLATFNVSLNRNEPGQLSRDLASRDRQIQAVATIIRIVRPDVLLLNEVDYAPQARHAEVFEQLFLSDPQIDDLGSGPWPMPHIFSAEVNTGVPSGLDLNANGRAVDPEDAWGFGRFPGQYGMAVLSRYELDRARVRTFQKWLWSQLPEAQVPRIATANDSTRSKSDAVLQDYYPPEVWSQLRLSSKSFWDVPIKTEAGWLHVLASHPTPPAFDGPEDRNGCRNHDEIKLLEHYIDGADFLRDDAGQSGGLPTDAAFVVLGDLNSDPVDGDSRRAAIERLLRHPRMAQYPAPTSRGASLAAARQAGANLRHRGDPAADTGDFNDRAVGNLRIDYVLPSLPWQVVAAGVFWPAPDDISENLREALQQILRATDHHLVWVDVVMPTNTSRAVGAN